MLRFANRILLVLIGIAIVGGTSVQLVQASRLATTIMSAGMPCDQMMPIADTGHQAPLAPCKGITPGCIKVMGCVSNLALPERLIGADTPVSFSRVVYWFGSSVLAGFDSPPEPVPPRTI